MAEAWNGIGNDAAYNHAQTPRGASAHGANTPPLRRKRGFGIMDVLNLSAAQMWFCEFRQAMWLGS